MKRVGLLMALCLLGIASASAEDFKAHGLGTKPCVSFVYTLNSLKAGVEVSQREISQYLGWVNGYATGAGLAVDTGPLKGVSGDDKIAWLRHYCSEHPNDPFYVAAAHLLNAFVSGEEKQR